MLAVHGVTGLRDQVQCWRLAGERIALVPTMGNLHAGHLKLVEEAHRHATRAVVSIFVNPLQFGPGEDYQSYPRTLEADQTKLQTVRADLLFAPAVEEMYPRGREQVTRVEVPGLSAILDGEFRPGHFSGVATVVLKLLNIVQPDVALFGEKDYQQLLIVRQLAADLSLPVEIVGVPIVREADGLAMSSRNQYLTAAQRQQAPLLYRTLGETAAALRIGRRDFSQLEDEAVQKLSAQLRPDYVSIRAAHTLAAADANTRDFVVLAAVWLGKARLIDNIQVTANESRREPPLPQNS